MGKRIGAVWALKVIAKKIDEAKALGKNRDGALALLQVIARTVDQDLRLWAVRFAKSHTVCDVLGIEQLDEDDWKRLVRSRLVRSRLVRRPWPAG